MLASCQAPACSDFGHSVVCVDKDPAKIALLEKGEMPILRAWSCRARHEKTSRQGASPSPWTLQDRWQERMRLHCCWQSRRGAAMGMRISATSMLPAREIAGALTGYCVIVTKSTVPVGTGMRFERIIHSEARPDLEFAVVSNPEFLREGAAISDFKRPGPHRRGAGDETGAVK